MTRSINIVGAGIFGLWQAYELARLGHQVQLYEKSETPFASASSRLAGAMLAPYCETEPSQPELLPMAIEAMALWQAAPFDAEFNGTLVVAPPRDRAELTGFAKRSSGHERLRGEAIGELEPDLAGRFHEGLFYEAEGHLAPRPVMQQLLTAIENLGGKLHFGVDERDVPPNDLKIDTRGMGAAAPLTTLRPVRGEMAVLSCREVTFSRPIRLLHPRVPCYVVPWPDHQFMVGATVIESADDGPVTVRSALELLGAVFTLHPAFGEAKILEMSAGLRPSLPDNLPRIRVAGDRIYVNGAYRHGFLLAPLLAVRVAAYIETGEIDERLMDECSD